jgi:nicotinate-nucleotide adenylyltransferase
MRNWTTAARLDQVYTALGERLSPRRMLHVLGACHTAVTLAERWGGDPSAALAAALLHDIAKELDLKNHPGLSEMDAEDAAHPGVWHAALGASLAREEFGVDSPLVERAIRVHPTGDGEMSLLDRIVYLSDYIEPCRTHPGARRLRELARRDLAAAADHAILEKTDYVQGKGKTLHARSERARAATIARTRPRSASGHSTQRSENERD